MASATRQFTKRFIDTWVPKDGRDTVVRDAGQTGLALRVRPNGTRTLLVQWYEGKRQRRSKLGRPDEFTSIKAVRDEAAKVLQGMLEEPCIRRVRS